MVSRDLALLHPTLTKAFLDAREKWNTLYPNGPSVVITCTYRSPEEQDRLFDQPRDKKDNNGNGRVDEPAEKVTNARAGQSPHNYKPSFAFDIAFTQGKKTDWSEKNFRLFAPLVLQTPGITWGGNFKSLVDLPHFELTHWRSRITK